MVSPRWTHHDLCLGGGETLGLKILKSGKTNSNVDIVLIKISVFSDILAAFKGTAW